MAKVTGLGGVVTIADSGGTVRTVTNDITNYTLATPRGVQDVTGLDKSAHENLLLLADYSVTFNGVFNSATGLSHDVFKNVPTTSVARATVIQPTSAGASPGMTANVLYTDYQITRANTGELTWSAPGVLSDGTAPVWA